MKQTGSIVVLVAYGMDELYCLVGLVELGPPYHDPAVKIDILLDVPPQSSVSWVNSRMHNPEGEGVLFPKLREQLEQPHSAAALKTWFLNTKTGS
jgi:hypothetical protein